MAFIKTYVQAVVTTQKFYDYINTIRKLQYFRQKILYDRFVHKEYILHKLKQERAFLVEHFKSQESRKSMNIVQQVSKVYDEGEIIELLGAIHLHQASLLYLSIMTRTIIIENECIDLIKAQVADEPKCLEEITKANKTKIEGLVKRIKHQKNTLKKLRATLFGASSDAAAPDTGYLSLITKQSLATNATAESSAEKRRQSSTTQKYLVIVDPESGAKTYDVEAWMKDEGVAQLRKERLLADTGVVEGLPFQE